jgi:hypothetical protein
MMRPGTWSKKLAGKYLSTIVKGRSERRTHSVKIRFLLEDENIINDVQQQLVAAKVLLRTVWYLFKEAGHDVSIY